MNYTKIPQEILPLPYFSCVRASSEPLNNVFFEKKIYKKVDFKKHINLFLNFFIAYTNELPILRARERSSNLPSQIHPKSIKNKS